MSQYIHKNSKYLPYVAYLLNWLNSVYWPFGQQHAQLVEFMPIPAQEGIKWIRLDQIGSDWIRLDQIGSVPKLWVYYLHIYCDKCAALHDEEHSEQKGLSSTWCILRWLLEPFFSVVFLHKRSEINKKRSPRNGLKVGWD